MTRAQHGEEEGNIKTEGGAACRTALIEEAQTKVCARHTLAMKPPGTGAPRKQTAALQTELSEAEGLLQ